MRALFKSILISLSITTLISCGGGSTQTAGIGGTGITSSGSITGFGSIFVNGVEYETDNTTSVSGSITSVNDLKLGMTVTVRGTLDQNTTTGTASSIAVMSELEGPIAATPVEDNTTNSKSFTVLGRTIIASTSATVFDGSNFSYNNIAQNDVIEASGYIDGNGALIATRIEKKGTLSPGSTQVEIRGVVGNILSQASFELIVDNTTLAINHDGSTDFSGLSGGSVTTGQVLEVEGTLNSATVIAASKVSLESSIFNNQDDDVELEGIITDYVDDTNFKINGQAVNAGNATFSPSNLQLGNNIKVEVEGSISGGVLIASEVESEETEFKIFATVAADPSGNTLTMDYNGQTLTVLLDAKTSLEDETDVFDPLRITDISMGDYLEIEAMQDNSGNTIALSIKLETFDPNGEARLKGPISAVDTTTAGMESVTILGIVYPTDSNTVFKEEVNDNSVIITRSDFLSKLSTMAGSETVIKIEDDYINGSLDGVADEMEIDN